ncbi:hypothetical protein [Halalkalicoccus jeotgali]|uniref:Uncharacterized protein n=1 Tax=Halalkalicoccus jeotgali (strain DSM 18796 / CECT 7217 / JCM 14584 / KCTC 4019 / B3) TaxID=795797 RepID=D8J933_HALJB|nr:hypothetical protein [Halalkalicoccus jeotgali]ADJ16302.1 hypothetical protein HacjB3_14605 [Halalkalicoccus jeotgali B3]ELY37036.1 hypothetical protein C497_09843 [Halalkalicoccus jeotgali B3]
MTRDRISRRRVLGALGVGGLGLGSAKAIDNVVLGYGVGGGTNLREQDLDPLLAENRQFGGRIEDGGTTYHVDEDGLWIERDDDRRRHPFDERPGDLAGDALALFRDAATLVAETTYEYHTMAEFFERLGEATPRPLATAALRGSVSNPVAPAVVERFCGVSPANGAKLLEGLKEGFREYGHYDIPRYVAGSVEDNIVIGRVDLRAPFEGPTDIETLIEDGSTGLFCYELSDRAIEAIHSVAATDQRPPLAAFWVRDRRHKHVYNGLASVVRDDGRLRVPVTFLDYTHSTLYDDLRAKWVVGEGLDAYGRRHRADEIYWSV